MAKSKFWEEFKAFAIKGNAVELAVGVVIGGAFGKIVSSLVNDVIMPLVGTLIGGFDFTSLKVSLPSWGNQDPETVATLNYGNFIQQCVDFFIIAFCIFFVIKLMNKALNATKKAEEEAPAAPAEPAPKPDDIVLLEEIRDLLKAK